MAKKWKTSTETYKERGWRQRQVWLSPEQLYLLKVAAAEKGFVLNKKVSVMELLQRVIGDYCDTIKDRPSISAAAAELEEARLRRSA